ncbi:hypothetical protein K1Y77_01905 [Halomonas qaidamensis]|uniref:Uncharacterized protein n=1 Tax=Halomonas qaidamensis TaxID=2866211 RepID=A0ABY6JSG7_9GAMM|nr:hypothetical protein [Halomonas qaidamensis]UYV19457.1 hypothetical protein K1Y77_01905 [Halomonas qaidamensis]
MPAPLIIWGVTAGISALAGLGYAGYKIWEEHESATEEALRAHEAVREAHAAREHAEQQALFHQQLRAIQQHVFQEFEGLGVSLKREPTMNELAVWAALHSDNTVLSQAIEDEASGVLFALMALPTEQENALASLLVSMGNLIDQKGDNSLLISISELREIDKKYRSLSALKDHVSQSLSHA